MKGDFRTLVTRLWASLRMQPPSFGARNAVVLSVDGLNLDLFESEDGRHVVVRGAAGRLAPDQASRTRQLERLLRFNLGYLPGNRACVSLQGKDSETPFVIVEAVHPLDSDRLDHLTSAIQDVLTIIETYGGELKHGSPAARQRSEAEPGLLETVIFRP